MTDKLLNILLVEDDELDVMNVRRAFKKNNILNPLFVAENGVEALEALRGQRPTSACPPHRRIVLLDLNMPKMGGIEFLRELRADDDPAAHSCDRADYLGGRARQSGGVPTQRGRLHSQARHAGKLHRNNGDPEQILDA